MSKNFFFDNLLGAVVHTILCDNKVQPDLFSHAKWDETSFIIHVLVNTCLTGLSMEEQYHHSSEWHLWDSSYFLLLGEWYSFHVIRREKEYGTYQTRVCLGKILSLVPGFFRY